MFLLLPRPYPSEKRTSPLWRRCQCPPPQTLRQAWSIQPGRVAFVAIFCDNEEIKPFQWGPVVGLCSAEWLRNPCKWAQVTCNTRDMVWIQYMTHPPKVKATYSSAVTIVSAVIDLRTGGRRQPWENWELGNGRHFYWNFTKFFFFFVWRQTWSWTWQPPWRPLRGCIWRKPSTPPGWLKSDPIVTNRMECLVLK